MSLGDAPGLLHLTRLLPPESPFPPFSDLQAFVFGGNFPDLNKRRGPAFVPPSDSPTFCFPRNLRLDTFEVDGSGNILRHDFV